MDEFVDACVRTVAVTRPRRVMSLKWLRRASDVSTALKFTRVSAEGKRAKACVLSVVTQVPASCRYNDASGFWGRWNTR